MDAFPLLLTALLALVAGLSIGYLLGGRRAPGASAHDLSLSTAATAQAVGPVKESLDRFGERLRQLESSRIEWHTQLREQVDAVRLTSDSLRKETASLATALRRPQVRGRWGEMHLKRTAELAGMIDHCDFELQVSVTDGDSVLRPDMVVRLAGDKRVVVDSKVPLDAYLDAAQAETEAETDQHLRRHVRQVRTHIDQLAAKSYWSQFDQAPEFVVLFVPGESILSAALEVEPTLLEHASAKKVVLATPTTLIALLRTVAYAWTQEQLAADAREIQTVAREMYERIGTVAGHVDRLGRSLESTVRSYNEAVGSIEARFLVTARRFNAMHVSDTPVTSPRLVETTPRAMTAPELVDELRSLP
ncbi:DNA recombination protein RmuC [Aeromicrobium wangtongii]|uniref:DNA recombination protein RmuC n=1 Tax=Aeromicrobium wangtongii TaxID=2969247 RepID=UPI0020174172|nr:DNA recombination protein RmuC [Aeromicrobium wangtongii]MCL3817938.1 DNA recombination protein RmuC [Aeromicrobium wangtongii]